MHFIAEKNAFLNFAVFLFLVNLAVRVNGQWTDGNNDGNGARGKRGAAYAGSHPGGGSGGYGQGGVGIPGINNAEQYAAYNTLLQQNSHGGGGGGGYGSSHGRKLTVDQAIGMFGHHTLNRPSPYTGGHGSSGGGGGRHGGGGGGGGGGGSYGR